MSEPLNQTAAEPPSSLADPAQLLEAYLEFYREVILRKLDGMSEAELRSSRLPSGWTPVELLQHLTHVERRWFQWGFAAEQVDAPWGDNGSDGRWRVRSEESTDDLVRAFRDQAAVSRSITATAELSALSSLGGRFQPGGPEHPTLAWIMFHVLQEYARHAGHLNVVRELADGAVGE